MSLLILDLSFGEYRVYSLGEASHTRESRVAYTDQIHRPPPLQLLMRVAQTHSEAYFYVSPDLPPVR